MKTVTVTLSEAEAKELADLLREYGESHYVVGLRSQALWSVVEQIDDKFPEED